jgi:hypothetical protein
MSFDQAMLRVRALNRRTLAVMAEIERGPVRRFEAGMELGEARIKLIHKLLAEIAERLRRLPGPR